MVNFVLIPLIGKCSRKQEQGRPAPQRHPARHGAHSGGHLHPLRAAHGRDRLRAVCGRWRESLLLVRGADGRTAGPVDRQGLRREDRRDNPRDHARTGHHPRAVAAGPRRLRHGRVGRDPRRQAHCTLVSDAPDRQANFDKYSAFSDALSVPYDYASIMHYHSTAFTANGQPTLITLLQAAQSIIGQRDGFSACDLLRLNQMYSCGVNRQLDDSCRNDGMNSVTLVPPVAVTTVGPPILTCSDAYNGCGDIQSDTSMCDKFPGVYKRLCNRTCNQCRGDPSNNRMQPCRSAVRRLARLRADLQAVHGRADVRHQLHPAHHLPQELRAVSVKINETALHIVSIGSDDEMENNRWHTRAQPNSEQ